MSSANEAPDSATPEPPIRTAADLLASDLVGFFADREDIVDSQTFAAQLRAQAETEIRLPPLHHPCDNDPRRGICTKAFLMATHATRFVAAILVCLTTFTLAQAADRAAVEDALLKKLNEPARSFEFFEAPVAQVIMSIAENHDLPMVLDEQALADGAIATDTLITKHLKGISLKSALSLTLADHGMDWALKDEVILVTTREAARRHPLRRIYGVHDLVSEQASDPASREYAELVDLIKTTVAPETWQAVAKAPSPDRTESVPPPARAIGVSRAASALVILHTPQVHEEIESLLASLRRARKEQGLSTQATAPPTAPESAPKAVAPKTPSAR
jgi:hypothetical protein